MLNQEELSALEEARQVYEQKVASILAEQNETPEPPRTTSGIPLSSAYTPSDIEGLDYLRDLGFPGEYPFASSWSLI